MVVLQQKAARGVTTRSDEVQAWDASACARARQAGVCVRAAYAAQVAGGISRCGHPARAALRRGGEIEAQRDPLPVAPVVGTSREQIHAGATPEFVAHAELAAALARRIAGGFGQQ